MGRYRAGIIGCGGIGRKHATAYAQMDHVDLVAGADPSDLKANIDGLRQVGHNVILTSLALKAFRDVPQAVTPVRLRGLCQLIEAFHRTAVPMAAPVVLPDMADLAGAAAFILAEWLRCAERFIGRGQGWSGHLLTYGRALLDLRELGETDLAACAEEGFAIYIRRIRLGPLDSDQPRAEHPPTSLFPLQAAYWKQRGFEMKNRSRFVFHIEALNDEDWMVRAEAAMMLGRTGPFTRATVPALSRALTDDVVHVRYHAAVSLGRLGEQARAERSEDSAQPNDWSEIPMNIGAAVPALNSALSDGEEAVRGSAAFALGLIGESAHAAIPTIIQTLQDSNWWVRANAAMALGRLCQQVGRSTQTAVHALERALSDESQWVRHAAAGALGGIGQSAQAAVPALVKALRDDENDEVRLRAIGVLGEIGELAQVENPECVGAAVPALREALRDKDSRIRRVAEMVLCRMGKLPMTAGPTLSVNRPSSAWHHDSNRNRRKSPSRMGTNASGLSNPMYPRTRRASIAVS